MKCDVLILGAGPVGLTAAALLAKTMPHWRIVFLDNKPAPNLINIDARDARHIAMSHGSKLILQQAGLWPQSDTASKLGFPLHAVHVSQQGRLGRTLMTAQELKVPALGYMVNYTALVASLTAQLPASVQVFRPAASETLGEGNYVPPQCSAALTIHAEGGLFHEKAHEKANEKSQDNSVEIQSRDYSQTALLGIVQITGAFAANKHQAWERFTQDGPVALLPLGGDELGKSRYSLVWCTRPQHAAELQQMSDGDRASALAAVFGGRFAAADITFTNALKAYPLGARWKNENNQVSNIAGEAHVTLGNAAQTLHPVAGQGLNLGLRDAMTLCEMIACDTNVNNVAAHFPQRRARDRNITRRVTDSMAQWFASTNPLIQHGLGLGLLGLDMISPLRRWVGNRLLWGQRAGKL